MVARRFVDLHTRPALSEDAIREMADTASKLDFSMLGVTFFDAIDKGIVRRMREICDEFGIELVSRIDLRIDARRKLLSTLGKARRSFEIIGVICVNDKIAHSAAKDRRVDVLNFPRNRALTRGVAELASRSLTVLEINACDILGSQGFGRIQLLSKLRREVKIAEKYDVPLVVSSGARDKFMLRAPRDLAFLITSLLDMKVRMALKTVSENPLDIVVRNREKLSPSYVMPGVRIVDESAKTLPTR